MPFYDLLLKILNVMEEGKAISIVPVMHNMTTQQAAELLVVSRPFFVKLLETGNLPYHLTGTLAGSTSKICWLTNSIGIRNGTPP